MFGTHKYLWGNIPALDIMNIEQNEGTAYNKDIGLCFAGESNHHSLKCIANQTISIR